MTYLKDFGESSGALRALQLAWEGWLKYRYEGDADKC
jgi:hypothetical protein